MTGGKIVLDTFIIELLDRGQVSFYQELLAVKTGKAKQLYKTPNKHSFFKSTSYSRKCNI